MDRWPPTGRAGNETTMHDGNTMLLVTGCPDSGDKWSHAVAFIKQITVISNSFSSEN